MPYQHVRVPADGAKVTIQDGKLRVSDEVLEKPAPLDPAEFSRICRHSFET